jgi:hypothetical protein
MAQVQAMRLQIGQRRAAGKFFKIMTCENLRLSQT